MSVADFEKATIDKFRGPWLRPDVTDVPLGVAILSLNADYNIDQIQKRRAFIPVIDSIGAVKSSMFNWVKNPDGVSASGSYLAYYDITLGECVILPDPTNLSSAVVLFTLTASGVICASSGTRLYITPFAYIGTPVGAGQCRVITISGSTVLKDIAFMGPLRDTAITVVVTNSGGGLSTPGTHRFGFLVASRSGFVGKFTPVNANGTFVPYGFISAVGSQKGIAITATWPTDAVSVQLVATVSDDLNSYFLVPGQLANVTGGTTTTENLTFNISDGDLLVSTNITSNLGLLTRDTSGNGPFSPHFVGEFGSRMGYVTDLPSSSGLVSIVYFSDPEDHQHITADQHGITLPGFKKICCFFVVRKVCYLVGPEWTYAVEDSGDVPQLWATPALVDGQIGTEAIHGITVNASGGFAWIVSKRGLEIFSAGAYGARPGSYYVDNDWRRINFAAPICIDIVDDQVRQRVLIAVPLDGTTAPTHIMCFSYAQGLTPEALAAGYSLWNIDETGIDTIGLVINPTTKTYEPWIFTNSAVTGTGVLSRYASPTDASNQRDLAQVPISFLWESGILPNAAREPARMYNAQAVALRCTGVDGSILNCTLFTLDSIRLDYVREMVLLGAPGQELFRRFKKGMLSQGFTIRLEESTIDGYVAISLLTLFYTKSYGRK